MHNYVVDSSQTVPAAKCGIFDKTLDNTHPCRLCMVNISLGENKISSTMFNGRKRNFSVNGMCIYCER